MSVDLIKEIAQLGLRVFTKSDVMDFYKTKSYSLSYGTVLMTVLKNKGALISLGKGMYTLPIELLAGGPIHPFEIASKLAKEGAISHRSAMAYHHLTDQVISDVYITVPRDLASNRSRINTYILKGTPYHLIRIDKKNYWGLKRIFIGEASLWITDCEKTLIDGLSHPELCGGMREVFFAFEKGAEQCNPKILLDYAKRKSRVVCKRLGWILEQLDIYPNWQDELASIPMKSYQRLDPTGQRKGKYNKKWMIVENI